MLEQHCEHREVLESGHEAVVFALRFSKKPESKCHREPQRLLSRSVLAMLEIIIIRNIQYSNYLKKSRCECHSTEVKGLLISSEGTLDLGPYSREERTKI